MAQGNTIKNAELKLRIIEISYKYGLSHLGSCLTAVDIINDIYIKKKENDVFILSQGHAGLALYVVLEKFYGFDAEMLWNKHQTHPTRDLEHKIHVSTGSLGHGLAIGLGMAMANPARNVYVLTSDGELYEGITYEARQLRCKFNTLNLMIYVNNNGYTGYEKLTKRMKWLDDPLDVEEVKTNVNYLPFLSGLKGHYHKMTEQDYLFAKEVLK